MIPLLRIVWLAAFLIGFSVLVSLQFVGLPPDSNVLGFVRIWLPVSGAMIFCLAYILPREPAVWAVPVLAYLVPAAWFREAGFVNPLYLLILVGASALSAWAFRKHLAG
ncbi:hypothetical protein [Henriciella aquimarina]|uniref:hypothetical protein n=1 Tax=Henriciella aquimarina TaxID=545261 RepID=UPI000A00F05A|nr:hypothetical protein [Henriciella aquimarina]